MSTVDLVTFVLYFTANAASLIFVISYARTKWFRTLEGWVMMGLHLVVLGFMTATVVFLRFGDYPGRELVRLGLFAAFNVVMWGFATSLIRAQRRAKQKAP